MKAIVASVIAVLMLGFAGCASERETVTTTTTSRSNSTTDTSALDPSRNSNMQQVMSNPMGMGPR